MLFYTREKEVSIADANGRKNLKVNAITLFDTQNETMRTKMHWTIQFIVWHFKQFSMFFDT